MSDKKVNAPTATQIVAASLANITAPLGKRMQIAGSYLTLTHDFVAQAFKIEVGGIDGCATLRVKAVRLNRLNIVDEGGQPDLEADFLSGHFGSIEIPFSELATRNATISLYELDWLLSQHVAAYESVAVANAVHAQEVAGD
jgi:hypothetical protein